MNRRDVIKGLALLGAGTTLLSARSVTEAPALPEISFHNLAEIEPLPDGGWRLSRVPASLWPKLNASAQRRAYAPAGAELRFNLAGEEARLFLRKVENRGETVRHLPALAEIYHGDFLADWVPVRDDWTEIVVRRPEARDELTGAAEGKGRFATELVRVALPCLPDIQLLKIEGGVSPARPGQVPARRYLAYGSSITNGAHAVRPGDAYPARVARALGVDHFNLGFGGGAYLEPEMADWIATRRDWDFATLEMGINLAGRITVDEFEARVAGFLPRIAAAHPDKWIFCIDLFTARGDYQHDPKYPAFRRIVRDAVGRIGSSRVVHCDGRELLTRPTGLTLDLLHPSSDGFEEIAAALVKLMGPALATPA